MADFSASPCVGICRLDEDTGFCLGCGRTGDEIADWSGAAEADRRAVWEALPARFDALGVAMRRLPWSAGDIRDFVARTLREASGTWALGVVGAVGEFTSDPSEPLELRLRDDRIEALTPRAALRLDVAAKVRAFAFEDDRSAARPKIILALHKAFVKAAPETALARLGPDAAAIRKEDREALLYDLGLGRRAARFCVRIGAGALADRLDEAVGHAFPAHLRAIGAPLLAESPVRVIETPLGRLEVDAEIPPPGGRSPDGPHTHLLLDHLALDRELPAGMETPEDYVPGAVYYPAAR